jgi:hypothetical protein
MEHGGWHRGAAHPPAVVLGLLRWHDDGMVLLVVAVALEGSGLVATSGSLNAGILCFF